MLFLSMIRSVKYYVLLLPALLSVCCCTVKEKSRDDAGWNTLLKYGKLWNRYNDTGDFDSIVTVTRPYFQQTMAAGDTLAVCYAATFMAQAFISTYRIDSAQHYIDCISPYIRGLHNDNALCALYNVQGQLALKGRLDYQEATRMFITSLELAAKNSETLNSIAIMYDIVNIFYRLNDRHGISYAEEAYSAAQTLESDNAAYCMSLMMMGMMHILQDDIRTAGQFCSEADSIIHKMKYRSLEPDVCMIKGDMAMRSGDLRAAEKAYKEVVDDTQCASPDKMVLAYLRLGDISMRRGDVDEAARCYRCGLDVSYRYKVYDFRKELIAASHRASSSAGNMRDAMMYYDRYIAFSDSIENMAKEEDFYALLRSWQDLTYRQEKEMAELQLRKARQHTVMISMVCLLVTVMLVTFYMLYRKHKRMYMLLVDKHRQYVESFERASSMLEQSSDPGKDADRELYIKVEKLMREKKIYRQKGITREDIAGMLDTNRTYLSRAINTFSGKTFNNYINTWRINEAVGIISDPKREINAKQIADDLGYASVDVFYQVFRRETGLSFSRYRKELPSSAPAAESAEN